MKTPQTTRPMTKTRTLAIARCLGPDWYVRDHHADAENGTATLAYIGTNPDLHGAALVYLSRPYYNEGTWHWYGTTTDPELRPRTALSEEDLARYYTQIAVTDTHTAAQIAGHLTQRLLPTFLPAYRKAVQHRRADTDMHRIG